MQVLCTLHACSNFAMPETLTFCLTAIPACNHAPQPSKQKSKSPAAGPIMLKILICLSTPTADTASNEASHPSRHTEAPALSHLLVCMRPAALVIGSEALRLPQGLHTDGVAMQGQQAQALAALQ